MAGSKRGRDKGEEKREGSTKDQGERGLNSGDEDEEAAVGEGAVEEEGLLGNKGITLDTLKFLSWNVNGLNEKIKRNKIQKAIRNKKYDVICFQETHIAKRHRHILVNKKLGVEFVNSDVNKKKGVVIYAKERWEPKQICKDEEGRILGIQLNFRGERINVVSVYAPNAKSTEFFGKLESMLLELEPYKLILLGDWNGVPTPSIDRSENQRNANRGKLPNSFNELVENLDLIDIWRHRNPTTKQFTHYSEPHQSWGRIDQIWVTRAMVWRVKRCEILPRTLSDHCPLILEIKMN
uniref:exodeoxyribonuclease III n=1 Tax=Podarcis muralis TaxID=64176 RepID=A0A670KGI2_PODMU